MMETRSCKPIGKVYLEKRLRSTLTTNKDPAGVCAVYYAH